jgi:hypothetical protein
MYPVLRYPGNVTGSDQAQTGAILGWDEVGRPYEVIDAEYIPLEKVVEDQGEAGLRVVDRRGGYTNVFLQYATPDTLRAAREQLAASRGRPSR